MTPDKGSNGGRHTATARGDPLYDLPLVGDLIARVDRARYKLPLGKRVTRAEADVLRAEARALRLVANALDSRAAQLEKLDRGATTEPRLARITLD